MVSKLGVQLTRSLSFVDQLRVNHFHFHYNGVSVAKDDFKVSSSCAFHPVSRGFSTNYQLSFAFWHKFIRVFTEEYLYDSLGTPKLPYNPS